MADENKIDTRTREELIQLLDECGLEINALDFENSYLQRSVREWISKYEMAHARYLKAENCRVQLVADAQRTIRDGLHLQLQSFQPQSDILLIYADRVSLADPGTFAQVNQMIRDVCKNVKLTVIIPENIRLEEMNVDTLGNRGLMVLPTKECLSDMKSILDDYQNYLAKYAVYGNRTLLLKDIALKELDG